MSTPLAADQNLRQLFEGFFALRFGDIHGVRRGRNPKHSDRFTKSRLATEPDAQLRNGPEAVRLAEHACELTQRKQPRLIGTLAAAYAEAGRFADAVKAAEEAARVAEAMGDKSLAAENRELLALYSEGKPYRETP